MQSFRLKTILKVATTLVTLLVFPSASPVLFSRLYLTSFDCVIGSKLCSVSTSWYIKSNLQVYLLFCLLVFSVFYWSIQKYTKYLSKIKINSAQHQLTLTKALKSVENNGFIFNKISVVLQLATISKLCFGERDLFHSHSKLIFNRYK